MNKYTNEKDKIVEEVHQARAELLAEHGGDLGSLLKTLREKQDASGRKVIERLSPPVEQKKVG